ncbi:MAG TPA: iron chelate uptake ABC transporter family permease subunit [Pirellulales bacterium]|nr:iron chelate uptake ABC transporter family permease subunit [Pirellulales bacterium]
MIAYNTAVVLAGASLLGASTGLVGGFAVLRRRALLGDALAHAALPGVCLAFLVLDRRNLPAMLLGALVTGILGVSLLVGMRRATRVKEDAAIGIVLSVFFGAGLALSRIIQNRASGGSRAGLDSYIFGSAATMRLAELGLIAAVAAVCLAIVFVLYKEFKLVAFDMGFARVQGWPAGRLDLLLMGLIAVTVVIGLPAVGAVLVAAMLILPATAARFWTERLGKLLVISAVLGAATAAAGTLISAQFDGLPTGPTIVLVGAAAFLFSALFALRRGAVARVLAHLRFKRRLQDQRLLRAIFEAVEADLPERPVVTAAELAARAELSPAALHRAAAAGWLSAERGGYRLSEAGLARAASVMRGYRLWRLFLHEYADQHGAFGELDVEAVDERLPADLVATLEERLAAEGTLPHAAGPFARTSR